MMAFFCSSRAVDALKGRKPVEPLIGETVCPVDMKGLKTGKALKPREVLNLPADEGKIRKGRKIHGADHEAGGIVSPEKRVVSLEKPLREERGKSWE